MSITQDVLERDARARRHNRTVNSFFADAGDDKARVNSNMEYIRSIMNPMRSNLVAPAPDGAFSACSFVQTETLSCTYTVQGSPIPFAFGTGGVGTDLVDPQTGIILVLPQESPEAFYHMGFVNGKKDNSVGVFSPASARGAPNEYHGLSMYGHVWGGRTSGATTVGAQVCPGFALVYQAPIALPRSGESNSITVVPPLARQFSRANMFTGVIKMYSSTQSAGAFLLAGTCSAGAVADTRDLSWREESSGTYSSYSVTNLAQQSISTKDVIQDIPINRGIASIIAPDAPQFFGPPTAHNTDTLKGEWYAQDITKFVPAPYNSVVIDQNTPPETVASICITPYPLDFYTQWNGAGTFAQGSDVPWQYHTRLMSTTAINETGVVDTEIQVKYIFWGDATPVELSARICCNFTSVFATIDGNNIVQYNMFSETQAQEFSIKDDQWNNWAVSPPADANPGKKGALVFRHCPRKDKESFTSSAGGKFLFTYVAVSVMPGNTPGIPEGASLQIQGIRAIMTARNVDYDGRTGPAHVLRYDNVAAGQVIQIKGTTGVSVVAQGEVSGLVRGMVSGARMTPDPNIHSFVDSLFRSAEPFARNYPLDVYENEIIKFVENMTPDDLLANSHASNEVISKGQAAGFFSQLGRMGGDLVGGLVDDVVGGASGMYGGASGMYGGASGMYGGASALPNFQRQGFGQASGRR